MVCKPRALRRCLGLTVLIALLLAGCGPAAVSRTSRPQLPQRWPAGGSYAAAARDSYTETAGALNDVALAASTCSASPEPARCLAAAAAAAKSRIVDVLGSLASGPRFPAAARRAYGDYDSVLENLNVEMQKLSEGDPQIQQLVLSVTLPIATRQFMSYFEELEAMLTPSVV
jgi:hypothetical protein